MFFSYKCFKKCMMRKSNVNLFGIEILRSMTSLIVARREIKDQIEKGVGRRLSFKLEKLSVKAWGKS